MVNPSKSSLLTQNARLESEADEGSGTGGSPDLAHGVLALLDERRVEADGERAGRVRGDGRRRLPVRVVERDHRAAPVHRV